MNDFEKALSACGLTLKRSKLPTLQSNVGRKCNQTCRLDRNNLTIVETAACA